MELLVDLRPSVLESLRALHRQPLGVRVCVVERFLEARWKFENLELGDRVGQALSHEKMALTEGLGKASLGSHVGPSLSAHLIDKQGDATWRLGRGQLTHLRREEVEHTEVASDCAGQVRLLSCLPLSSAHSDRAEVPERSSSEAGSGGDCGARPVSHGAAAVHASASAPRAGSHQARRPRDRERRLGNRTACDGLPEDSRHRRGRGESSKHQTRGSGAPVCRRTGRSRDGDCAGSPETAS